MKKTKSLGHKHRFPTVVTRRAVRWYFRFKLSLHDVEELMLELGVSVTYESFRRRCNRFGAGFARHVKAAWQRPGLAWYRRVLIANYISIPTELNFALHYFVISTLPKIFPFQTEQSGAICFLVFPFPADFGPRWPCWAC